MFDRLKALVFGSKKEESKLIVSQCKTPGRLERWVVWLLSHGVQPNHVAFVLDSTDVDFVRQVSASDVVEADMNIVWRMMSLATQLGTEEITTQLLQRFPPRNGHDMQAIYRALKETLKNCLEFGGELDKRGVQIRAFGDLDKLPEEIQRLIAKVEIRTENNDDFRANITFGNAGRYDVSEAVTDMSNALLQGKLRSEDLTVDFLGDQLSDALPPPADLYIKTSDVSSLYASLGRSLPIKLLTRSFVYNLFIKDHLPDLAFWTYAKALLSYQTNYAIFQQLRQKVRSTDAGSHNVLSEGRRREFQKFRQLTRHKALIQLLGSPSPLDQPLLSIEEAPREHAAKRNTPEASGPRYYSLPRRIGGPPSPATQKRFSLNFRSS